MSGSNYCFLTCIQVSQEAGEVVWYSYLLKNFPQFAMIHQFKGFWVFNEAKVDVLLEFHCFCYDPVDPGNLLSGSSVLSKSSLNIWNFSVHILLKPSLKDFDHDLASFWNECNRAVDWTSLALPFFEIGMKMDLFWSCGHCWVFQICWHIELSIFRAPSFRIWNSWGEISSPPLAWFLVTLSKAHLTSHSSLSGSRWVTTLLW